ncbi:MAG: DnaJ domain-containing protein [Acidobacteriota bacterium]|jgi:tetratricopeptide (TPR) repeat protein
MVNRSKLPEVLLNLAGKKQSGVFRAQKANVTKQLIFKDGAIAFAESNQADEHLAHIMVSMGFIKQSDLSEVVSLMKQGKNSEEAVFTVPGSESECLNKGISEQVIVVLSSLLSWGDFEMRFFAGENLIKNRRNMALNVPEMLVFSARRAVSKRLIPVPRGFLDGTITADKDRAELRMKLPLDDAESFAYVRAHDEISAKELLPLISANDSTPEDVLLRLYALGLLAQEKPQEAPAGDGSKTALADEFGMLIEDMLVRFESASMYEILSIKTDADINEIQVAYHDLAKQFHPDRFQSDNVPDSIRSRVEQVFAYINEAYMTLKDPDLRAGYDRERLKKGDNVEAAIKSNTTVGAEEEKMIKALFRQGQKSLDESDFEKAVKELKSCVHLRPENARYNYYLGLAESEIPGLYKSAEQHLLKAIEMESIPVKIQIALAKLYLKVGLPRKASGLLDQLLLWDPGNPEVNNLLEQINQV